MAILDWQLTIDCAHPETMVRFWAFALGWEKQPPPQGHETWNAWYLSVGVPAQELDLSGDGCDRIQDPTGQGPPIWFQPVPEGKTGKNRLHLDLYPAGRDRSGPQDERRAAVDRRVAELVEAGARVHHLGGGDQHYFVQLRDPEDNEFCVA